jgi:transposase InsO family protein
MDLKSIRVIEFTGKTSDWEGWSEKFKAKANQKNVSKVPKERAEKAGERLSIDMCSPKTKGIGGKQHWLLVVDDCTDFEWSFFLKKKSDLKDEIFTLIRELKEKHGIQVKYIRGDNSGKNRALEKLCKQEGLGITFEYTAPGNPQQNGRVERKFATVYGRVD